MENAKCIKCGSNSTLQTGRLLLPQAETEGTMLRESGKTAFIFKVYICDECHHVDLESVPV